MTAEAAPADLTVKVGMIQQMVLLLIMVHMEIVIPPAQTLMENQYTLEEIKAIKAMFTALLQQE